MHCLKGRISPSQCSRLLSSLQAAQPKACRWEPLQTELLPQRRLFAASVDGADAVHQPRGTFGAGFLRGANAAAKRQEAAASLDVTEKAGSGPQETLEPENETRKQLQRLFRDLPGHASQQFAYLLHCRGKLEPKVSPALDEEKFGELYRNERWLYRNGRRLDMQKKRRRKRNHFQLNEGYSEPYESYEAEVEEFGDEWRLQSIVEDCWKAEYYQHLHRKAKEDIPERGPLAARTDRLADVAAAALRSHYCEQNRPVLTHELADYENPYMMKHSALERLLHERCVRNQLDERVMPRVLESHPDLVKLRAEAPLPPEVLEPLAAFRGDVRWHFDARQRLALKLDAAGTALQAVADGGDSSSVASALPENAEASADQVPGVHHPWKNHVGFESAVPRGFAGGTKFGQPETVLEAQVQRLRYPTLQRVAHTLPADLKWRAHVVRAIRVLERSKHWDFASKLAAINKMKEVYDNLKPSAEYTAVLDEKLPINRVPSHLKRRYARDAVYFKTYPKNFMKRKSFGNRYRPSLTATAPLKKDKK